METKLYAIQDNISTLFWNRDNKFGILGSNTKFFNHRFQAIEEIEADQLMGYSGISHLAAWAALEDKYKTTRWNIEVNIDELKIYLERFSKLKIVEVNLEIME